MAKVKKIYVCTNCGANSPKWVGNCPSCNEWNTYQEEVLLKNTPQEEKKKIWQGSANGKGPAPVPLTEITAGDTQRLVTPDNELNRVLGGGVVSGSLVLVGGQPGIGKSTLVKYVFPY